MRSFPIHTKWAQPVSDSDAVPQNHWAPGTAKLRHILYHKGDLTKQERFLTSYKLWSISGGTKYLSGVSEFFEKDISNCFMSRGHKSGHITMVWPDLASNQDTVSRPATGLQAG